MNKFLNLQKQENKLFFLLDKNVKFLMRGGNFSLMYKSFIKAQLLIISNIKFSRGSLMVLHFIFRDNFILSQFNSNSRWNYSSSILFRDTANFNIFFFVLKKISPAFELKPVRMAGSSIFVPVEVTPKRQYSLALLWLIAESKKRSDVVSLSKKLALECVDILFDTSFNNKSLKFVDTFHKEVVKFRAFSHMRW